MTCARERHVAHHLEPMQRGSVFTDPENGMDGSSERRRKRGGNGTEGECVSNGTKGALRYHLPSSHLVVSMPAMKTPVANTPMTAEYRSADVVSTNTMEARSPSFT